MPTPINAPVKRGYRAYHTSGTRPAANCQYVVTHCGEAQTAVGMARWFTNPNSGGSTNLCVDSDECYQTVLDLVIPWGAPPLNTTGLHCELAGYSAWKPSDWLKRKRMLQRAAWRYAKWSIKYDIPPRWLTAAKLRKLTEIPGKGEGGFTSHAEISKAWKRTDHTDPGPGFIVGETTSNKKVGPIPRNVLMSYTRKYRKEILAPKVEPKKAKSPLSIEQSTIPPNQDRKR